MRIDRERLAQLGPEERKEAEGLLAELDRQHEENPLLGYNNPTFGKIHPKQLVLHASRAPVKAFIGGNRSGKTTAAIADNLIQAVDADCLPSHLKPYKRWQPPFYCRIVSPDFTSTMEGVVFQKLRELAPRHQLRGGGWEKAYDKQLRVLRFANGSWFQFLTSEQDLDKFGGAALHRVHYDEEPPGEKGRQIRQENLMRLIDYGGDEVFSMTPLMGLSWVYEEVWEKRQRETAKGVWEGKDLFIVTVDMDENPHLDEEAKQRILAGLTKQELKARKEGRFVHFAGLVYDEFDPERHECDPPSREHLEGQDIYIGIDPGVQTTGVVFCAFDRDNHMLVFDELYLHDENAIPENAAEAIRGIERKWGISPNYYVIDPSARNRTLTTAENVQAAYQRAGIAVVPGQAQVEAGVFEIKRRLENNALLISRGCQRLLWERSRYRIKPREDGKFEVVKAHDHLLDPCLAPGSLVAMEGGEKRIEEVRRGERVWTRDGLRLVEFAGMTNPDVPVWRVVLEDGRELVGTAHHPLWVEGEGWVRMDAIRYGDIVSVCQIPSSTEESSGVATPIQTDALTGCTTAPQGMAICTGRFGKTTTARSPSGITSTTATVIRSTTSRTTSFSLPQRDTFTRIGRSSGLRRSAAMRGESAHLRRNGTIRRRGEHGMPGMPPSSLPYAVPSSASAISAGLSMSPPESLLDGSVLTSASRRGAGLAALTTRTESARHAARVSGSIAMPRPRLVPVRVLGSARAGRSAVYDLTVQGSPEFFANGILVHNTRYVTMSRPWHVVTQPEPEFEPWQPGHAPPAEWFDQQHVPSPPLGDMT